MSWIFKLYLAGALVSVLLAGCDDKPDLPPPSEVKQQQELPTAEIELAGETFTVEIAFTEPDRRRGLAGRRELAADRGMIFIFDRPRTRHFWMKDCYIDLDVIFIRKDLAIAKIATMKAPQDQQRLPNYSSVEPIKYVLELPAGTAERLQLKKDRKINLPEKITRIIPDPD